MSSHYFLDHPRILTGKIKIAVFPLKYQKLDMVGRSENLIYNYISIFVYFSFLKIGKKGKNAL